MSLLPTDPLALTQPYPATRTLSTWPLGTRLPSTVDRTHGIRDPPTVARDRGHRTPYHVGPAGRDRGRGYWAPGQPWRDRSRSAR